MNFLMHNTVNSRKSALLPSAHCEFSPYIITQIRENLYNYFNFFFRRAERCAGSACNAPQILKNGTRMRKYRKSEPVPNPQRKIKMQTRKNEAESADFRFGFGVGVKIFLRCFAYSARAAISSISSLKSLSASFTGCAVVISTPAIFRTEMGSMLLPALRNLM